MLGEDGLRHSGVVRGGNSRRRVGWVRYGRGHGLVAWVARGRYHTTMSCRGGMTGAALGLRGSAPFSGPEWWLRWCGVCGVLDLLCQSHGLGKNKKVESFVFFVMSSSFLSFSSSVSSCSCRSLSCCALLDQIRDDACGLGRLPFRLLRMVLFAALSHSRVFPFKEKSKLLDVPAETTPSLVLAFPVEHHSSNSTTAEGSADAMKKSRQRGHLICSAA